MSLKAKLQSEKSSEYTSLKGGEPGGANQDAIINHLGKGFSQGKYRDYIVKVASEDGDLSNDGDTFRSRLPK